MDFAATGEHVKGVRIEGIAAGAKSSTTVYDLTLANVLVTKVADAEGDGYSLSLDYSKIALVTQGIDDAGKISQNGAFGFDRTAGNAFDPLSLAPIDITSGPLSINENSANGTLVGTLTGQDPDNQALAYTLTNNATGRFAIDNAGHVTVENGVLLDFEQNASHTIGVRVTDSDGLVFDKSFVVTVNDLNPEVGIGDTGPNTIVGGSADDTVNGQGGDDVLLGGGGNDYITSGDGNDKAFGDAGNDTVIGSNGDDYLNGGADADLLVGNDGADTLLGDTGNDYLDGGSGDDLVMGGAGDDTVLGADGTDICKLATATIRSSVGMALISSSATPATTT
jgi:Ca2+-binding RTX toxin-like protein